MKTITLLTAPKIIGLSLILFTLTIPVVFAASPHYIKGPSIKTNSNLSITISGSIAGLAAGTTTITASDTVGGTATWQCVNHGGNSPAPKQLAVAVTSASLNADPHNGRINFALTLGPPAAASISDVCGPGNTQNWSLALLSVTYAGVSLQVWQNALLLGALSVSFGDITVP